MQEERYETFYKNIEKVFCPYFKEDVHFTETGLDHLKFKNKNHHPLKVMALVSIWLQLNAVLGNPSRRLQKVYQKKLKIKAWKQK